MFAVSYFNINMVLTGLFAVGLIQLSWLAVIMRRAGVPPRTIWLSSQSLMAIWVVLWPAYTQIEWVGAGVLLWFGWLLWLSLAKTPFFLHLKQAWSVPGKGDDLFLWPPLSLALSLLVAALFFYAIPEFGLGLALCAVWLFPLADLLDRFGWMKLQFPLHPNQTLVAHLALIVMASLLCSWSIHLYHGMSWQQLGMATGIAGIAASLVRALLPGWLNQPIAVLVIGGILWAL